MNKSHMLFILMVNCIIKVASPWGGGSGAGMIGFSTGLAFKLAGKAKTSCPAGKCVDYTDGDGGKTSAAGWCRLCESGRGTNVDKQPCVSSGTGMELFPVQTCPRCEPGFYSGQNEPTYGWRRCEHCPIGKYQDKAKKDDCKICGAGQAPVCVATLYGKYGDAGPLVQCSGAGIDCAECAAGRYLPSKGKMCQDCISGQYQEKTGQSTCKPCENGNYQNEQGQSSCKPCDAGKYHKINTDNCVSKLRCWQISK